MNGKSELEKLNIGENISHAYIFAGKTIEENINTVKTFVKFIHCPSLNEKPCDSCISCKKVDEEKHEDVIHVKLEGLSIGVDDVNAIQVKLTNKPYISKGIIVVIENADKMTIQSQNKLLKSLEEPNVGNVIILMAENQESLLKTIKSRCVTIRLSNDLTRGEQSFEVLSEEIILGIFNSYKYNELVKIVEGKIEGREAGFDFLDVLQNKLRDILVLGYSKKIASNFEIQPKFNEIKENVIIRTIEFAEQARVDLHNGTNVNYCLKNLMLKMAY